MRKLIVVLLALCLSSACNTPQPLEPQKRADIRSIAVISALGDQFHLQYVGFVIFLNKSEQITVDWRIDDHVRALVNAKLKDRYQIVDIAHSSADVVAPSTYEERAFGSTSAIIERLRKVVPPGQVDAVVFVTPYSTKDAMQNIETIEGIGLYNRATNYRGVSVFATYRVIVFDGRTFEFLASAVGSLPPSGFYRSTIPYVRMPWRWTGAPWDSLTAAQHEDMRWALLDVIDRSLNRALSDVSLTAGPGL